MRKILMRNSFLKSPYDLASGHFVCALPSDMEKEVVREGTQVWIWEPGRPPTSLST